MKSALSNLSGATTTNNAFVQVSDKFVFSYESGEWDLFEVE